MSPMARLCQGRQGAGKQSAVRAAARSLGDEWLLKPMRTVSITVLPYMFDLSGYYPGLSILPTDVQAYCFLGSGPLNGS